MMKLSSREFLDGYTILADIPRMLDAQPLYPDKLPNDVELVIFGRTQKHL